MKTNNKAIQLWWFSDAPKEYRELSEHGGDEDYLAFVPEGIDAPWWIWCKGEYKVKDGTVYISAHA